MNEQGSGRLRVRMPYIEWLLERLSERDLAIVDSIDRVRILTGHQLERLHFHQLDQRCRSVVRWRVLKRLVDARVLTTFDRRVGAAASGSTSLRYVLDSAGQHLMKLRANARVSDRRVRRPRAPGQRFVAHALAVSEPYVMLAEQSRCGQLVLDDFRVEAAAYWPNGVGGWVKPDAFVKLRARGVTDYWWYEADMATEDLSSTLRAKLMAYLYFVHGGQLGPDGVVPRVLISVPTAKRLADINELIASLPKPADAMFVVSLLSDTVEVLRRELLE